MTWQGNLLIITISFLLQGCLLVNPLGGAFKTSPEYCSMSGDDSLRVFECDVEDPDLRLIDGEFNGRILSISGDGEFFGGPEETCVFLMRPTQPSVHIHVVIKPSIWIDYYGNRVNDKFFYTVGKM